MEIFVDFLWKLIGSSLQTRAIRLNWPAQLFFDMFLAACGTKSWAKNVFISIVFLTPTANSNDLLVISSSIPPQNTEKSIVV